jgi:hypothetical protein
VYIDNNNGVGWGVKARERERREEEEEEEEANNRMHLSFAEGGQISFLFLLSLLLTRIAL